MVIERLAIQGLTCLRHVALDLRDLPDGLIAVTGANGEGKTTFLESMVAPYYRTLPSRDGELVDYATADAHVEMQIAAHGTHYRFRVNLDGPRRSSDAVVQEVTADGAHVTYLNDGKVSTYDVAVRALVPSQEIMLVSQFAAQNKRGSFASLTKPKDKKDLFSRMLGLEAYEQMAQTAKALGGLIEQALGRIVVLRDEVARQGSPDVLRAIEDEAMGLRFDLGQVEQQRDETQRRIERMEQGLAALQERLTADAAMSTRAVARSADVTARQAELARLQEAKVRAEATHRHDVATLERLHQDTCRADSNRRDTILQDCDKKILGNQQLLARRDEVQAAVTRSAEIEHSLSTLTEDFTRAFAQRQVMARRIDELQGRLASLTASERDLATARRDAAIIERVPFGRKCSEASCQFLANAVTAQGHIQPLTVLVAEKPGLERLVAEAQGDQRAYDATIDEIAISRQQLTAEREDVSAVARYADALAVAEAKIAGYEETKQHAETDLVARTKAANIHWSEGVKAAGDRLATALADLSDRTRRETAALTVASQELAATQEALAAGATARQEADDAQVDLRAARTRWDALTARQAAGEAHQQALVVRRDAVAQAAGRVAGLDVTRARLEADLLEWQLLQRALGPNGLPILEIDAAGPTISQLTNDLLAACFGPRFSVELVTQQAKAGGKGVKESFDLLVTDNQRTASVRSLTDLSGGEQVIVNEALMNALGLYVNQRSAVSLRTAWRDETTGSLDPENAVRYIQMLRRVHTIGRLRHIFFISQDPEISAMADAQIRVAGGTATMHAPPYAA